MKLSLQFMLRQKSEMADSYGETWYNVLSIIKKWDNSVGKSDNGMDGWLGSQYQLSGSNLFLTTHFNTIANVTLVTWDRDNTVKATYSTEHWA